MFWTVQHLPFFKGRLTRSFKTGLWSFEFQVSTQNTAGRITVAACNCTHWVSFFVLTVAVTDFMHVKLFVERIPVHVPLVWRKPSLPRNRSADLASPAYNFNSDRAECAEDTALRVGAFQLIRLDAQKWLKNTCARGPGKKL